MALILIANAALRSAAALPLDREVVVGCFDCERQADADFASAFSAGLAALDVGRRRGALGGITGHVAESVTEVVLADHGWTPIWHFVSPGRHGVDLMFLDPQLGRLTAVEVKGTLRPGLWPRLRRRDLTQMDTDWLDKLDNPAMSEWRVVAADIFGAIVLINFADLAFKIALTTDFVSWHPVVEAAELDDLTWLEGLGASGQICRQVTGVAGHRLRLKAGVRSGVGATY